jgi:hypothetical protein
LPQKAQKAQKKDKTDRLNLGMPRMPLFVCVEPFRPTRLRLW